MERLYSLCLEESRIDILCNVILLVNLFRVIQCTSMHPRLNLLLGTLKVDVDVDVLQSAHSFGGVHVLQACLLCTLCVQLFRIACAPNSVLGSALTLIRAVFMTARHE